MNELTPGMKEVTNEASPDTQAKNKEETKKKQLIECLKIKMDAIIQVINECAYKLENLKDKKLKQNLIELFDNLNNLKQELENKKEILSIVKGNYVAHKIGNVCGGLGYLLRVIQGKTKEDDEHLKDSKKRWEQLAELTQKWINDEELFKKDLLRGPEQYQANE